MAFREHSPLPVINGGTSVTTMTTAYAPVCAGTTATGALQVASTGLSTSGFVLTSTGASTLPTFQAGGTKTFDGDNGTGSATGNPITIYTNHASGTPLFNASGSTVLLSFSDANGNTAIGTNAGNSSSGMTGIGNDGIGDAVFFALTSGSENVAVGDTALESLLTGSYNTCLGSSSGDAYLGAESSNILINNSGTVGESHKLRIGVATGTGNGSLNGVFIHGINGESTANASNVIYLDGTTEQQGTVAGGTVNMNSGTNTLNISSDNSATTVNIGTGGAVKTIKVGSTTSTSTTTLTSGSGGVQVATFMNLPTTTSANGQIQINGSPVLQTYGTNNTFLGSLAGNFTLTTGSATANTAVGAAALSSVTTGSSNVAVGVNAMLNSTTSGGNVALGYNAMGTGIATGTGANVAVGISALQHVTSAEFNVSVGSSTLTALTTGNLNTGIGNNVYPSLTSGSNNIAIGANASSTGSGDSNNILIGTGATSGTFSNILSIGAGTGTGTQQVNQCYICGITGINVGASPAVLVNASNQLGVNTSSIRFKENVQDMGDASSNILNLRPVTYNFIADPNKAVRTGLIAEEVLPEMPGLVFYNINGEIETVLYNELPALLLNELQKAVKRIEVLEAKLANQ